MLRSKDYHAHISQVHRAPSVLTDVPRYPNAHLAFNKKVVYDEDEGFQHHHHNPLTGETERVEVIEYEQTTVPENGVGEAVYQENVDVETDQYYPRKNKGYFELQKWKTFRP